MTSKLQLTLPKALAQQYRIQPGDDILWVASGESIRIVPARSAPPKDSVAQKLRLFDQATERQRQRQTKSGVPRKVGAARGWTREGLYDRGRSR